jgi:hypothetical protein
VVVSDINSGLYAVRDRSLETAHGSLTFGARTIGGVEGSTVQIAVERVGGTSGDASVAYETLPASADRSDYVPVSGRLSWSAGDASSRTFSVQLVADGTAESAQRFFVRLLDPKGGATLRSPSTASVFVSDSGATAELGFADAGYVVRSDVPRAMLVVQRLGSAQGAASVSYRTVAGTAQPGMHYNDVSGDLSWPDGDATGRTILVDLLPGAASSNASFSVALFNSQGATLGTDDAGVRLGDRAPQASAGADQSADVGTDITLSATHSSDPEKDALSYSWRELSDSRVSLIDGDRAVAHFNVPAVAPATRLSFLLTVTDAAGNATTDQTFVTVSAPGAGGGGAGGGNGGASSDGGGGAPTVLDLIALLGLSAHAVRARRSALAGEAAGACSASTARDRARLYSDDLDSSKGFKLPAATTTRTERRNEGTCTAAPVRVRGLPACRTGIRRRT